MIENKKSLTAKKYFARIIIQSKDDKEDFRSFCHCKDKKNNMWELRGYGKTAAEAADDAWKAYQTKETDWNLEELKELVEKPEGEDGSKWHGPYINDVAKLKDPWSRELQYKCPGENRKDSYDLWSTGKDGEDGNDDDLSNWREIR